MAKSPFELPHHHAPAAPELAADDAAPSLPDTLATRRAIAHDRVKGLARRTFSRPVLSEIGPPNGLFALDVERFPEPVLVSTAATVTAKLQLAAALGLHGSIGADLVHHCVNDVAIQGALPLFFMDSFSAGRLEPDLVSQVISGLVDACRANGCALLGGDCSESPALLGSDGYDLAGFLTGVVSRPRLLTGDAIQDGDCLLALPSNGLHSAGFELAQQLLFHVASYRPDQYVNQLGDKVGAALMRPCRSYLNPIRKLLQAEVASGFAHIASGGLTGDLPTLLPRGLSAQLDLSAWETPPLFTHLAELGGLKREMLFSTFNMGIGLVAFVPAPLVKKARATLTRLNERSVVIGRIVRRGGPRVLYS